VLAKNTWTAIAPATITMGTLPQRRATRKPGGDRRRSARSIVRAILFATTVVSLAWVVGFLGVFLWRHREIGEDAQGGVSSMMMHAVSSGTDRRTLEKGGTRAAAYGSPLLIFTCRRDSYLSETLEHVYASIGRPCRFGCPIIVSEDGRHPDIERVVLGYRPKFEALGIPLLHIRHDQRLRGSDQKGAYQALARHYGWALAQVLNGKIDEKYPVPQRVVILEEDIRVAPDFFSYMEAASGLLDNDPTLFAVSAFNDNGHQVRDPKRLLRSDFFPGLGWMMTRELWKAELESKWPSGCTFLTNPRLPFDRLSPLWYFAGRWPTWEGTPRPSIG
jgi:GNT-I family